MPSPQPNAWEQIGRNETCWREMMTTKKAATRVDTQTLQHDHNVEIQMASERQDDPVRKLDRRRFLAGVAIAGASGAVSPAASATTQSDVNSPVRPPSAIPPSAKVAAAETGNVPVGAPATGLIASDFMVDVIRTLNIEYVASNPANSFRGLHESLINYGGNTKPEFITCAHEESSVAIAHGYFKIAGKPMAVMCHGTVGLQHACMSIYNAWCDRVPVVVIAGNDLDASKRPPGVPTFHSAQDINALVRDFTKWDDMPVSLQHFAQSFIRAYKISTTPPYGPVSISLDAGLQEETSHEQTTLYIPKYVPTSPPQGDTNAVREAARMLANAQFPLIIVDRAARTPNGIKLVLELAETLQAPVLDQGGRLNMPNTHYLNQNGRNQALLRQADVIIGMELSDFWGSVNEYIDNGENGGEGLREPRTKNDAKLIGISSVDLNTKSNYQDFQRFQSMDVQMAADAEATLPALIEAVKQALPASRKAALDQRGEAMKKSWAETRERNRAAAAVGWDAAPITTGRMCVELYALIRNEDWTLASLDYFQSFWPTKLWAMDEYHRHIGHAGGYGVGYGAPAAVGAALANRPLGRLTINLQGDGDLMCAPGVLWTAAHHNVPLLSVVHNNRGYHQEVMHVQRMSNRRNRVANLGKDMGPIGTRLENPNIDFAKIAQGMGVWASGPITDPNDLTPAYKRALEVVKAGEPALVDVVSQAR
jgi:acetolactate synthase-1/2/3 large subunit